MTSGHRTPTRDGAGRRLARWPLPALGVALLVIGLATLTPGGDGALPPATQSVWQRVSCVTCSQTWLADMISNVLLFVPLGAMLVCVRGSVRRAVLTGACVSLAIELLQLAGLPTGRTPSLPDLVTNITGTWLGAIGAWHANTLRAPGAFIARRLRTAWALLCVAMFAAVSLALSPATRVQARPTIAPSPLEFTPGYGWFAAVSSSATVNDMPLTHVGSGPVIVAMARPDSASATVNVEGRDRRGSLVPIVFVHDPAMTSREPRDTRAHLLLAQQGSAAALTSDLAGPRWGLHAPVVHADGAFVPARGRVALAAYVTPRAWTVTWRDSGPPRAQGSRTLRLSPAIGWVLLQSVVTATAPAAMLVTLAWLFAWFAPLGYWARGGTRDVMLWAGGMLAAGAVMAQFIGIAPLSWGEAGWCVFAAVSGAWLRRRSMAKSARQTPRS